MRFEANGEMFGIRRAWHHSVLSYVSCLNITTARTSHVVLAPLSSMMQDISMWCTAAGSTLTPAAMVNVTAIAGKCNTLATSHRAMAHDTLARIDAVMQKCTVFYYAEPDSGDPFLDAELLPVNEALREIEGFLFVRRNTIPHTWRRCYVRVADGFLTLCDNKKVSRTYIYIYTYTHTANNTTLVCILRYAHI